jgi:hypothetical protein
MKAYLLATAAGVGIVLGALCSVPAHAALITLGPDAATEGLVYTLEAQATADPLTEQFALVIAGENSVTDTRGGRTGINAIAFNTVSKNNPASGQVVGVRVGGVTTLGANGFNFVPGGLASSGCDGSGGFYCFDNTLIPPTPVGLLSGPIVIGFEATLTSGSWANYTTALKIDWVGSQNNYSLVSEEIPVNAVCPDCVINPVVIVPAPEPFSIALLGVGLTGLAVVRRRRRYGP